MRIIAGQLRGKRLNSLGRSDVRPTADRVREALFNILGSRIKGRNVLDLFAGSGALGIESLSRGAAQAHFIDSQKNSLTIVYKNVEACGLEEKSTLIRWDILRNLNCLKEFKNCFDLVFMDPPYQVGALAPTFKNLAKTHSLVDGALVVLEHSVLEPLPKELLHFVMEDQRCYGKTLVSFLSYMV